MPNNDASVMAERNSLAPQLLALDWGTSSLRAFLLGAGGAVLDTRASAHGIQNLPQPGRAGFEQAFAQIAGDWLQRWPSLPLVAGGMVGSAQGWVEAAYVKCPADTDTLAAHAVSVDTGLPVGGQTNRRHRLLIVPGLLYEPADAAPDVLRGEEIQIAGALLHNTHLGERFCVVLPGTHSKWVVVNRQRIERFATYMTGELYAVLRQHSILGRLFSDGSDGNEAAFAQGVAAALDSAAGDLPHQLFSVRTLGLTGKLGGAALKEYLSGILIGHELVSGLAKMRRDDGANMPLVLIGEPSLCQRYASAFTLMGVVPKALLANTAPAGLYRFADAAGLLGQTALPHSSEESAHDHS